MLWLQRPVAVPLAEFDRVLTDLARTFFHNIVFPRSPETFYNIFNCLHVATALVCRLQSRVGAERACSWRCRRQRRRNGYKACTSGNNTRCRIQYSATNAQDMCTRAGSELQKGNLGQSHQALLARAGATLVLHTSGILIYCTID